jgi:UDP-N-acetylmuramate--alanine ligase
MIDFRNIEGIYFVGIGGIGMSALALYFRRGGYTIAGYDRSESSITWRLGEEGCYITYDDDVAGMPDLFRDPENKEKILVVYTPAIPADSRILEFFRQKDYRIFKRAEILGELSENTDALAISGTHGKTTVSTMTAHLLAQSEIGCSAFLGGISKNYNSNLIISGSRFTVMEADEFDRSFLRLSPYMAVVTSMDADHLDIYGNRETMIAAYNEFCARVRKGGKLFVNFRVRHEIIVPSGVSVFTYGSDVQSDYHSFDIINHGNYYTFDMKTPAGVIRDLRFPFPGIINIENFTAAAAVAMNCGVTEDEIRKAALLFKGVKRRFDIRFEMPLLTYIDDYAHHPEEIRSFIKSVKEYFRGRRITGIFQPHLYSRTRDHAEGFAASLDELNEVILLPIYPAREKPIEGVTSGLILEKMKLKKKRLMEPVDIIKFLMDADLDVLLTIGAGDIDKLAGPIEEMLRSKYGE